MNVHLLKLLIPITALRLLLPCEAAEVSSRTALIIGIGNYSQPEIPALAGVKEDMKSARSIAKAMGIPDQNIRILQDQQASKAGILDALRQLGETTADGARTFVYFSGHGSRWKDPQANTCVEGLLTYDYKTITNSEIAEVTKKLSSKADKFVVMFDACHSAGVAPQLSLSRDISPFNLTPKFYMKSGVTGNACSTVTNLQSRGLMGETTRLGSLPENFVQITSSLATEVSFDEPGKGGLATQGVRDCLLGKATDLNASGAVSMAEVQHCAQRFIDQKIQNSARVLPHHVTVSGNRNLIPVPRPKPPVTAAVTPIPVSVQSAALTAPVKPQVIVAVANPVISPTPAPQPSHAPLGVTPLPAAIPTVQLSVITPPAIAPLVEPAKPSPALASLATLRDIEQQRNPKRVVNVTLSKAKLKIGKDSLDLQVNSSHDGYVYLVMLGSDANSFYILFPNGLDGDNRIRAKQTLRLPKVDWQVMAAGPAGTDHILVMVSDTPRKLDGLNLAQPSAAVPFTYALNDLPGRSALIDFLTGSGVDGSSESFGAKLLSVEEVP